MKTTHVYEPCTLCRGTGTTPQNLAIGDWTHVTSCEVCCGTGKGALREIREEREFITGPYAPPLDLSDPYGPEISAGR